MTQIGKQPGAGSAGPDVAAAFAVLEQAGSSDGPEAAMVCHRAAAVLDDLGAPAAAEVLHRRAGVLLAAIPAGGRLDRQRVSSALGLVDNLAAQHRMEEAGNVLRAAAALARGLLGPDDPDTAAVELRLAAMTAPDLLAR